MKLRWLRCRLRQKLRLKAAPRLEVTQVTAFFLTGRAHRRAHIRALAPARISHRNSRNLSNDGGLRRNFYLFCRNRQRNFLVFA